MLVCFRQAHPTAGSDPAMTREGNYNEAEDHRAGLSQQRPSGSWSLTLAGCGGAGGGSSGGGDEEVNVLIVNDPQMQDLQKPPKFTKDTGIKVNYTVLPENEVHAKIGQDLSAQAGNYDVASMSTSEVPTYAKNGWLTSMDEGVVDAEGFNQGDILAPMAESMTFEDQIYRRAVRRGLP